MKDARQEGFSDDTARLHARLERMVSAGRTTDQEAARVRSARTPAERDAAVAEIRLRHVREWLETRLRRGRISQEDADAVGRRVESGEHPSALRDLRGPTRPERS